MRKGIFYPKTDQIVSGEELAKLKGRYENFPLDSISQIIEELFGEKPVGIEQVKAWGIRHVLYKVALKDFAVIFRANVTAEREEYFFVEKWAQGLLEKNGLPNYKVFAVDSSREKYPFDYMVMEAVEGKDIESTWPLSPETEKSLMFQCGELLAKIHRIKTRGFGFFDEEKAKMGESGGILNSWEEHVFTSLESNLQYLLGLNLITEEKAERIRQVFKENKSLMELKQGVLVHGDYCDHNVMVSHGKITGVIDWEDCISGDPVHDIAFWSTFYPRERLPLLMEGYKAITAVPKDFQERFELYRLRIAVSKAVLAVRFELHKRLPVMLDMIGEELELLK